MTSPKTLLETIKSLAADGRSVGFKFDNFTIPLKLADKKAIEIVELLMIEDCEWLIGKHRDDFALRQSLESLRSRERNLDTEYAMSGVRVLIGLQQQGHIPTIEQMLARGATWDEIGKEIGWCPETAKEHYGWYMEREK